jgi:hypothetical protein
MTVVEATEPSEVRIDLVFDQPFTARNDTAFVITHDGAGSRVTWTMTGSRTLGIRVMNVVTSMDALVGPDFELASPVCARRSRRRRRASGPVTVHLFRWRVPP